MQMQLTLELAGGGLSGHGFLLPPRDIRGFKFGCEARKILLELPHSSYLQLERSAYESWQMFPRPSPPSTRKVMNRLYAAGLVWHVHKYNLDIDTGKESDNNSDYYYALTDLGQRVVEAFGSDMKRGKKIRWEKWVHPSIACTEELSDQMLDKMVTDNILDKNELSEEDLTKMKRKFGLDRKQDSNYSSLNYPNHGNSIRYLLSRIARYDLLWGDVWMKPFLTN